METKSITIEYPATFVVDRIFCNWNFLATSMVIY